MIKIEGRYDIVIKDDDLEGTVVYKDRSGSVLQSFKPPELHINTNTCSLCPNFVVVLTHSVSGETEERVESAEK